LQAFVAVDLRILRFLRLLRILKLFRVLVPAWHGFSQLNRGRTFRQHVHAIVWPSRFGGQIHNFFDLFIIFWVLLSVLSVLLETVTAVHYILALEFAVMDSIAVGVFKAILVMVTTPMLAKFMRLSTPRSAMVFGGLAGTVSGVSAGLAATDRKLVPYGALVATFHTGLGCLLCPSLLYFAVRALFPAHA
jgi:hypothetical protein